MGNVKTLGIGIAGGIIGVVVVLIAVIVFPTQINEAQEIIEKQSMHPCQKVLIDDFELLKKNARLASSPNTSQEDSDKWGEEFLEKIQQFQQIAIENNCQDMDPEWYTEEFKKKFQLLLDEGF